MERGESSGHSNFVTPQPSASTAPSSEAPVSAPDSGVPAYRVPTATPDEILEVPDEVFSTESRTYCNKVVLGFESEFTAAKAGEWVRIYNLTSPFKLVVVDELPNALFVVLFDADDLLAASLLVAGLIYASVNDLNLTFDPCNQADFRHLVTVNISRGNAIIFNIIRFLISNLGTYVKGHLGADHQHISLVVETTLKLFPAQRQFRLKNSEVSTLHFDYEGRNLRCCFCFSYRHIPANCKQPRPRFFLSPSLQTDVALGEPRPEALGGQRR